MYIPGESLCRVVDQLYHVSSGEHIQMFTVTIRTPVLWILHENICTLADSVQKE